MTISLPAAPEFGTPVEQKPRPELLEFLAARRSSSAVTLIEPAPSAGEIEALISLAARVLQLGASLALLAVAAIAGAVALVLGLILLSRRSGPKDPAGPPAA